MKSHIYKLNSTHLPITTESGNVASRVTPQRQKTPCNPRPCDQSTSLTTYVHAISNGPIFRRRFNMPVPIMQALHRRHTITRQMRPAAGLSGSGEESRLPLLI